MSQQHVLIISADLRIGGAQAVAANIAKYADDSFRFTFLVFSEEIGAYEAAIEAKGNRIVHWPAPSNNIPRFVCDLIRFMRQERFDIVHCHTMFNCGLVMLAAKLAGVKGRISHSHTTKEERENTILRLMYRQLMRMLIHHCGNAYWACGVEAGHVLYSRNWFQRRGIVVPNGIDFQKYAFSEANRKLIRSTYGLEKQFVIGHTGHYVPVKNQVFLIDLMPEIRRNCPNAVLLLFGDGEDRRLLEDKIVQYNVGDSVRLMGNANNIDQVLSAFDVFVFPSLFEGTPLALIEAQANGLPCVISDTIPMDSRLTDLIIPLSLTESPDKWIRTIIETRNLGHRQSVILSENYPDVHKSMELIYAQYKNYI